MPEAEWENMGVATEALASAPSVVVARGSATGSLTDIAFPSGGAWGWVKRGTVSAIQQGLFAGSHFVANVLLARWLAPASYGVFALAYSFFLLLLLLYMALFYEPILVYGAGRYSAVFLAYVRVLVRAHFLILLPLSFLMAIVAPIFGRFYNQELKMALLVLAAASSFLLLVWLFRAAFYARIDPYAGAVAGACYLVLLVIAIAILRVLGMLSAATALGGMSVASFLVSAGCMYRLNVIHGSEPANGCLRAIQVISDHWNYGRWAAVTGVAGWVSTNIYYTLLPARFGLGSTAMLRALMNLMYPLLHSMMAIVLLLIPTLVRQREQGGVTRVKQTVRKLLTMFLPIGIVYLIMLVTFRRPLVHLLYGERYNDVSLWMAISVGILPITSGIAGLFGAAFRALERPRLISWAYLASMAIALLIGIPLTFRYGVAGATFALVVNDLPVIGILAIFLAAFRDPLTV